MKKFYSSVGKISIIITLFFISVFISGHVVFVDRNENDNSKSTNTPELQISPNKNTLKISNQNEKQTLSNLVQDRNSNVTEEWVARYNGPGNLEDEVTDMKIDSQGNVYVTGYSVGNGSYRDYATIKYNSAGVQEWVARYNGPGNSNDEAASIVIDSDGNVYVSGTSINADGNKNFATIKYSSNGNFLWVARYNGPGDHDILTSSTIDLLGNIYVTGVSNGDFATVKYNSNGIEQWVARGFDGWWTPSIPYDIAVDNVGNVYVTGTSIWYYWGQWYDYATIKYNSDGIEQWVARYDGIGGNNEDRAYAIVVDNFSNVYVTGESAIFGNFFDYATIKYNTNGISQWVARYNGPISNYDRANAIAIDESNNVYVTGFSLGNGTGEDYATVKYNSNGQGMWVARYNGLGNSIDEANAITVDNSGNVYVTGNSWGNGTSEDYATIKYNSTGIQQWVARYNGTGNGYDKANSIAVDNSGNIYIAGVSDGIGTGRDFATIKYSQGSIPVPNPSLHLSTSQINPGSSVLLIGDNFRPNQQINVRVTGPTSEVIYNQNLTSSSNGGIFTSISTQQNYIHGIYTVSAKDVGNNQSAPSRTFEIKHIEPPYNLHFTSPIATDSLDQSFTVEWRDKMTPGPQYQLNNTKREYKYKVNYSFDDGNNWSTDKIVAGWHDINSVQIINTQFDFSGDNLRGNDSKVKIRVTDYLNQNRIATTQNIPIKISQITDAVISFDWDNSFPNLGVANPIGVCADGVSRIYIKIDKKFPHKNITNVSISLTDDIGSTNPKYLGKIVNATVIDGFSDEANYSNKINSLNENPIDGSFWFWYVSPGEFVRNNNDKSKSERTVKANITVFYSDGSAQGGSKNVSVIRTPLMMMHGIASNGDIWNSLENKINSKYKFISNPSYNTSESFAQIARQVLLNGTREVDLNSGSFRYLIQKARNNGYASNQVTYVSHSMGGCIVRAAANEQFYKIPANYRQGFVNRIITIDTPHLGSLLADLIVNISNNLNGISGIVANSIIKYFDIELVNVAFEKSFVSLIPSASVKNLQSVGEGKFNFENTNIPSFLIAGDFFPNDINFQSIDLSLGKLVYLVDIVNFIISRKSIIKHFFLESDIPQVNQLIINSPEMSKIEFTCKMLDLMLKKILNRNGLLFDSDLVVTINSQLAGTNINQINLFDKANGNQSSNTGVIHTAAHSDFAIINRIDSVLNLPRNDNLYLPHIPKSNHTSNFVAPITSNVSSIVDNTYDIDIISPVSDQILYVDSVLNISFAISDTNFLEYALVKFQGELYFDTIAKNNYNFELIVNSNYLDTNFLEINLVYDYGDSIDIGFKDLSVIIKITNPLIDFKVKNNFYYLQSNHTLFPSYKFVFENHLYDGILDDVSAVVDNPSVIQFNNNDKSFTSISNGQTFAIVNYNNLYDTIYFDVNGQFSLPAVVELASPKDSSVTPSSEVIFLWEKPENWSSFEIQISHDEIFDNIFYENLFISDTALIVSPLIDSTRFYWRVRAKNSGGNGDWSDVRTFLTTDQFPLTPILIYPEDKQSNVSINLTFKWGLPYNRNTQLGQFGKDNIDNSHNPIESSRDITNLTQTEVLSYWFEITSDTIVRNDILIDSNLSHSQKDVKNLTSGREYYWRVRCKNLIGWSVFSDWNNFKTSNYGTKSLKNVENGFNSVTEFGFTNITFEADVSSNGYIEVSFYPISPDNNLLPPGVVSISNYFWNINDSSIEFSNGKLKIPLNKIGGVSNPNSLKWLKRNNPSEQWDDLGGRIENGFLETELSFNSFSEFAIASYDSQELNSSYLRVKFVPEGLYSPITNTITRKDTVRGYLVNSSLQFVDSAIAELDSITFEAFFDFKYAMTGVYYLVIKHFNSLETWSKAGGESFERFETMFYDFTFQQTSAYGNNLVFVENIWCIFSGDVNQDGVIDAQDRALCWNLRNVAGYYPEDVNGDGLVNAQDRGIIWNNRNKSVQIPNIIIRGKENTIPEQNESGRINSR